MGIDVERRQIIYELLNNFRDLRALKRLFWTELNYDRVNEPLSTRAWGDGAKAALAADPVLIAEHGDFRVIYIKLNSDKLLLSYERPITKQLLKEHPYALFVFADKTDTNWHFVNIKEDGSSKKIPVLRRISIGPDEKLRTAAERVALLDVALIDAGFTELPPLRIQQHHDEAFNVEAVTKQFFADYKDVFGGLRDELEQQTGDRAWAHDFALQFLNRLMFLYFVQRKRWLNDDAHFLKSFWRTYQAAGQTEDTFVEDWLNVLFFAAFNNKFNGGYGQFPKEIQNALQMAPYLNGGLFSFNKIDDQHSCEISDRRFERIFNFLEHYNFTISEDSPLNQEVAVDPEMIGKVYESLVNVSEEADTRGDMGIFYTPRIEIDLMCRLSLVDNLTNQLGAEHKTVLYELVFAMEAEEKTAADKVAADKDLWPLLDQALKEVTVCDPACGSGSFLVGMLHVLDDLQIRAAQQLGYQETAYERKKRIIGQSLYGVDVMDWAVHTAELRLWLQLVIDTELEPAELNFHPLLPNLSFKIRRGDSLVQEIAGINLAHIAMEDIPPALKGRLTKLKGEKLKFYYNDSSRKFKNAAELEREELHLYKDILFSQQDKLKRETAALEREVEKGQGSQLTLGGTKAVTDYRLEPQVKRWRQEQKNKSARLANVEQAIAALNSVNAAPFVWDISFVEIFEGDKRGFDIIIGNPPYVRQENIADPLSTQEKTAALKREYKAKLATAVYQAFPKYFGFNQVSGKAAKKLNAKSDLYIYFYWLGLSRLNSKGAFAFITSNSWLDVGYGKDLQEFLLKRGQVKMVIDNKAKRSFAAADVNTVIALLGAPNAGTDLGLEETAKFIMVKVPFKDILSAVIFEEIEAATAIKTTPKYRVFPIGQAELLADGMAAAKKSAAKTQYAGNKWGGKYLRAPDIYWTIMKKGQDKLVRLGDIAEVRFGIKTGANEFFYLTPLSSPLIKGGQRGVLKVKNNAGWEGEIEAEFLKPVIKSPRECKSIIINPEDLKYKIFMCHKSKAELSGTAALKYIEWGEAQGFNRRPSCAGRARWWDLGNRRLPPLISPCSVNNMYRVFENTDVLVDKRLYEIYFKHDDLTKYLTALNSTITSMFLEINSRIALGEGLLDLTVYEIAGLHVLQPILIKSDSITLSLLKSRNFLDFEQELEQSDRRALDNIIFDTLGLTKGERDAVYEAVIELVSNRLTKAKSV